MEENKRVKSWLKRKVRITEALMVAFFISGNLGHAQESSNQSNNTVENGIAIGRIVKVKLGEGVIIEVEPKSDNRTYSFAEKGTAKAELAKDFSAGFRLTNLTNKYNQNYETMIGATNGHIKGDTKDRYANMKEENCQDNCEDNKLVKSIAIGSDSVARNASIAIGDYAFASRKRRDKDKNEDKENVQGRSEEHTS